MSLTFQRAVNPQHYRPGGLKVAKPLQVSGWGTLSWWSSPPIGRCGQLEVMVSGHMVFKGLDSQTCGSLSTLTIYPQKSKGSQWVETRNRWRWALEKHPVASLHTPAQPLSSFFPAPHTAPKKNSCSPDRSESRMFTGPHWWPNWWVGFYWWVDLLYFNGTHPRLGSTFSLQLPTCA